MNILFVCTGGICRSPMAANMTKRALEGRGDFVVQNAGTLGRSGEPTDLAQRVMVDRGYDLSDWRSVAFTEALSQKPDLIIGLTREHAGRIIDHDIEMMDNTFTLKELVRRAETSGRRQPNEEIRSYLTRISQDRKPSDLAGFSSDDDIADPIGQPIEVYEECADLIKDLVNRMVGLLWPLERGADA